MSERGRTAGCRCRPSASGLRAGMPRLFKDEEEAVDLDKLLTNTADGVCAIGGDGNAAGLLARVESALLRHRGASEASDDATIVALRLLDDPGA